MSAAGTASDPVCLEDDDDDPVENEDLNRKRPALSVGGGKKRSRVEANGNDDDVPIKLLATLQDEQAGRRNNYHITLRELLGFDGDKPHASIQWLVVSNFLIEFPYLMNHVPELLSCPRTVFFYGNKNALVDASVQDWKRRCTQPDGSCTADFVPLVPSDEPRTETNPLPYRIPFGVHHTKLFLVGFSDGTLRVVIHTANLRHGDVHLKAQGAYVQDFPLKNTGASSCDFENDLAMYMESYRYHTPQQWSAGSDKRTLVHELRRYDFSSAKVVLLPSIPGRHFLSNRNRVFGHLKLRQAIQRHASSSTSDTNSVVCQFSSIGSLAEKWLTQQFLQSTAPGVSSNLPLSQRLKFVYPTVEEIRSSIEGYRGGLSVPGKQKNVQKPFLQPLFHKWRSSSPNPCAKGNNVPHIKTYYQLSSSDDSAAVMNWFVLASHNMSTAAWGQVQKEESQLFIRSWELGVFVSPSLLGGTRLVPVRSTSDDGCIPLPYKLSPDAYGPSDQPWASDNVYPRADNFGRHSSNDE